ncbi:hypothetical protein AB4259_19370 [Vibrio amylolyticus]|uniref:hypothetical protein n=1 Tax=Vibrio amylolyticus TaxID=2847292 RepID=UPI00354D0629
MKTAYHYDPKSFLLLGESNVYLVSGYDQYILPQFSSWSDLPIFNSELEQLRFNAKTGQWKVEAKFVAVVAYSKLTKQQKEFDDASLVTDDYTLSKPTTQYDEWINDNWMTNESDKYIAEFSQVDATREALYRAQTDPLENKAARLLRNGAMPEELAVYYDRINELEIKIKAENPWPVNPEA